MVEKPYDYALGVWMKYYRQFWPHLLEESWDKDLYQTVNLIALLIKDQPVKQAGKVANAEYYRFLRNIGFRHHGTIKYTIRELKHSWEWWQGLMDQGKPPKAQ